MNVNKVRLLRVDKRLLIELLSPDGTSLFKSSGMPDDAELLGIIDEPYNHIALKIWSEQFEEVPSGGAIPYMDDVQFNCIDVYKSLSFDNARHGLSWGSDALLRSKEAELRDRADKLKKRLQESVGS